MEDLRSMRELIGLRVFDGKKKKPVGKVSRCVFHPNKKQCIGLLVRRPDVLLMFHRKDLEARVGTFAVTSEGVELFSEEEAIPVDDFPFDEGLSWFGMSAVTQSGNPCGTIDDVVFDIHSGAVNRISLKEGTVASFLLGKRLLDTSLLMGYSAGCESIIVSDYVLTLEKSNGAAERAGAAAAVTSHKVKTAATIMKPVASKTATQVGDTAMRGAKALGNRAIETKDAFKSFAEEFEKAMKESDDE